jgi:hypothetical protein
MLTSWSMTWLIQTSTSSLTVATASVRRWSASDCSITRWATAVVRVASASTSARSCVAKYARMTSASVSTGMIEASTNARNSFR